MWRFLWYYLNALVLRVVSRLSSPEDVLALVLLVVAAIACVFCLLPVRR